jgi:hypothetical protein
MKLRHPTVGLPRAQALHELLTAPSGVPERLDPGLRKVLASRLVALAPDRRRGALRLDSYRVEQLRRGVLDPASPFVWSPRATRRSLGLAAAQRVLAGRSASPSAAVAIELELAIERSRQASARPGTLGAWLAEAGFGVLAAVSAQAIAYATELLGLLDFGQLGQAVALGTADPVWAVPGAPWVSLRGRRDAVISLDQEAGTRALFAVRAGRPSSASQHDLAHVALVDALTSPAQAMAVRVTGIWPATGKALSLELDRATIQQAARAVVEAMGQAVARDARPAAA